MADAFRGLTIRLGADARPLTSAINSITKSASEAQRQMNSLKKTLRFDPTNVQAIGKMVDVAGDKAMHSARQVQTLKTALKQAAAESKSLLKGSSFEGKGIAKMASETRDVFAATQKLRSEYNHVNTDLAHIYEHLAKVHQANMKANGSIISFEKALKDVKSLANNMENVEARAKAIKSLVFSGMGFQNTENNMFGLSGSALQRANQAWNMLKKMRAEQKRLNADLEAMNKIQGYRAIEAQLVVARAELKAAAAEAADFKSQLYALGGSAKLADLVADSKRLDNALEKATASAHEMKNAFQMLPKSMEAAKLKTKALADAEDTLKQKLAAARAVIKEIEGTKGFDRLAASTRNAYVDAEKAKTKYAKLEEQLRKVQAGADRLGDELKEAMLVGTKSSAGSRSVLELRDRIVKATQAMEKLKAKMAATENEMKTANLSRAFIEARQEVIKLEAQLAKLNFQKSIFSKFGAAGQAFRQFGYGFYSTITPAIMMMGRYAIQAARDVDSAYRDMRKTVNGAEEDFEHLKNAAIEFSRTHVTTAETMLEIEAMGGQLGIQVENLEAFAHAVSNIDIATNMDSDTIAQDLGKMATVMGMNVDEYDRFGDSLVRLGNNMPAMESDIMNAAMRFMGMGKVVGLSADQILGWATAAVSTGQKAEAGGSSMIRFMSNMETAVTGGGEALQNWANVAGMSASDFAEAFKTDASGAMYSFIEGLGKMHNQGQSANQALRELGINNVRDKQLLEGLAMQMAGATDETNVLRDALRMSADAFNGTYTIINGKVEEAGDAMREAERKSEGFSGELQKMINNATALAVELGDGVAPWIKRLGALFEDLTGWFKSLSPEVKEGITGFLGLIAVMGPLNVAFGTTLSAIHHLYNGFKTAQRFMTSLAARIDIVGPAYTRAEKARGRFAAGLNALSSTKGMLAVAGITAAIGAMVAIIKEAVDHGNRFRNATDGLRTAFESTSPAIQRSYEDLRTLRKETHGATVDYDELIEKQSSLAKSISDRNIATQAEVGMLQEAKAAIDQYAGRANLTSSEQAKLRAAIAVVNDECGTQYRVMGELNQIYDEQKKAIADVSSELDELIAKKQKDAQQEAIAQNYKESYQQYIEDLHGVAAAQAEVDELAAKLKENNIDPLASYEYTQATEHLREMKDMTEAAGDSVSFYSSLMEDSIVATSNADSSISAFAKSTAELSTAFQGYFTEDASTQLDAFCAALGDAGVTVDDFKTISANDFSTIASVWKSSQGDMTETLKAVGIEVRSLTDAFDAEMGDNSFSKMCDDIGYSADELSKKLHTSGVSAQQMAKVGANAFKNLYETSGSNIDLTINKLDALNQANIDPKELGVDDGQLVNAQGELIDFDNFQIGDKTYQVTADGLVLLHEQTEALEDETENLDGTTTTISYEEEGGEEVVATSEQIAQAAAEAGNTDVTVTFHTNADEAVGELENVENFAFSEKSLEITDNSDDVNAELDSIENYEFSEKRINVRVTGSALSTLSSIQSYLNRMTTYKEIHIHTKKTESNASGGVYTGIPRHASGALNGIVTSAQLTNIGWVGEAGAEAVMHMRNAGGAVVPLSNKRYVRPFARAVASEMRGGTSVNVNLTLDYTHNETADQLVRDIASGLENILNTEA